MDDIQEYDLVKSTTGTEWHGKADPVEEIGEKEIAPLCFDIVQGAPSVAITREVEDPETGIITSVPTGEVIQVEGYKMLLADLRHREDLTAKGINPRFYPIHAPKASYEVISNRDVYEMAKRSFEALGCKLVTAGTLGNLRKFFLSIDIGNRDSKAVNGDLFQNYLNFITSHDGTFALEAYDSAIRIVCMNTFRWSRETAGEIGVKFYHTKNVAKQMENLPEYLEQIVNNRVKLMECMNELITILCSPTAMAHIAAGYLANPLFDPEVKVDRLTSISFNRACMIRDLSGKMGKGNQGKTLYDLFNGLTEFFTHHDGAGGAKAGAMKRLSASKFGAAADHKDQFLSLLLNPGKLAEVQEFGAKLFTDKEKDMAK